MFPVQTSITLLLVIAHCNVLLYIHCGFLYSIHAQPRAEMNLTFYFVQNI